MSFSGGDAVLRPPLGTIALRRPYYRGYFRGYQTFTAPGALVGSVGFIVSPSIWGVGSAGHRSAAEDKARC